MEKEFVNYEIAIKLKEKGFNLGCLAYFVNDQFRLKKYLSSKDANYNSDFTIGNLFSAPLWQQVIDWLREKHNKVINLHLWDREDKESWKYEVTEYGEYEMHFQTKNPKIKCSYEQARYAAIQHTLTLI